MKNSPKKNLHPMKPTTKTFKRLSPIWKIKLIQLLKIKIRWKINRLESLCLCQETINTIKKIQAVLSDFFKIPNHKRQRLSSLIKSHSKICNSSCLHRSLTHIRSGTTRICPIEINLWVFTKSNQSNVTQPLLQHFRPIKLSHILLTSAKWHQLA